MRLPVWGERPPDESDASSRDGQEAERGAMASSWSKTWDGLQLMSEEPEAAELQRPATRAASLKVHFSENGEDSKPAERNPADVNILNILLCFISTFLIY